MIICYEAVDRYFAVREAPGIVPETADDGKLAGSSLPLGRKYGGRRVVLETYWRLRVRLTVIFLLEEWQRRAQKLISHLQDRQVFGRKRVLNSIYL